LLRLEIERGRRGHAALTAPLRAPGRARIFANSTGAVPRGSNQTEIFRGRVKKLFEVTALVSA
jgi:hypothetical protein